MNVNNKRLFKGIRKNIWGKMGKNRNLILCLGGEKNRDAPPKNLNEA